MHHRHTHHHHHPDGGTSAKEQNRRSLRVLARPMRRKSKKYKPEVIFKVIVAAEVIFLVFMWFFYSDRLRSSSLWHRSASISLHSPTMRMSHQISTDDAYDDDDSASEEEDDDEEERVPVWEQILREESRERYNRERKKRKREQQQKQELAKAGLLDKIPEQFQGPTLIIGGSDGSGTRAFAKTMLQLGVPMRVDDKDTLDVHGAVMYDGQGWPPLAKSILNVTHSANYELSDLPQTTKESVTHEMQLLKDSFDEWQLKFEQRYFVKTHMNQTIPRASNAAIGFKAPVTMLLLPVLKQVFGKVKYLHVVRDGRDVSLSTNKSPVQKFYQNMYTNAEERINKYADTDFSPVLAMHLWNDWNTQALEWEKAHASNADFDYLVMRSEDLVDPSKKFEALARLAAFVGSPKTLEELCCTSREEEVDMGKSLVSSDKAAGDYKAEERRSFWSRPIFNRRVGDRTQLRRKVASDGKVANSTRAEGEAKVGGDHLGSFARSFFHGGLLSDDSLDDTTDDTTDNHSASQGRVIQERHRRLSEEATDIHGRYGKWRERLKDLPDVSAKLHQEGAKGLAAFGYEPSSSFMDPQTSPIKGFRCDESVVCK